MPDPASSEPKPSPLPYGRAEPFRLKINVPATFAVASLATGVWSVLLSGPVIVGEAFEIAGLELRALALLSVLLGVVACLVPLVRRERPSHERRFTSLAAVGMFSALAAAAAPRVSHVPLYEAGGRTRCPSHLRMIGQAAHLYAYDHGGRFPDDVDRLLTQDIAPSVFVCPHSADTAARPGATTQATVANVKSPGHCSYIYIGKGWTEKTATADVVIAYESITNHRGEGMNVLYGDGHVDWVHAEEARAMLAELAAGQNPPRREQMAAFMAAEVKTRQSQDPDR